MEKATAVNTCLGVLMGRDCIYLDQVKQDALNNLTFTGDINGHLISQHRDEKDWFPYTLTFRRVLAYFACELDTYENLAGMGHLDGSSFDLIEDSTSIGTTGCLHTMMFTTSLRFLMSLRQSCKCLKCGRPLEGSIKEEGMVMKQNKHQLEHLPILLVQQLRLQWYKDCRGGNAAAQRNQYPRAMRLPKDFFSYYSFGLPTHFVSILQRPNGFQIDKDCRRLIEWKPNGSMRIHPFELIQKESGLHVRDRNDWHIGAMPERYTYDETGQKQPLNELALDLAPGEYGRAVCNGRFRDWDTGIWYYVLDILNVMPLTEPTDSLTSFTDREPNKIYTRIARLW